MSERQDTVVNLAERRPAHLAAVILRQNHDRLAEHRQPDKQAAAARDYVRARVFLKEFRWNLITFLVLVVHTALLAVLTYRVRGLAARDELILAAVAVAVAIACVFLALHRRRRAQQLVERSHLAAGARKAAVLSRISNKASA